MIAWQANNQRVYAPTREQALCLFNIKAPPYVHETDVTYCGPERRKKKRQENIMYLETIDMSTGAHPTNAYLYSKSRSAFVATDTARMLEARGDDVYIIKVDNHYTAQELDPIFDEAIKYIESKD